MNKILDWLSKLDFRTFLALVASFSVPVGPAFFFGWTFGTSVYSLVTPYAPGIAGFAAALVGLMVAVGLESVGMLSGYNSIRAWNAAAYGEALLASLSLGVYVILGISGVEGTLFGLDVLQVTTVFLMTPTAYIQMAVHYSLNRKEKVEQGVAEDAAADRREQDRLAHEDKLAQDQRDHEFKLAQLQAQKEARTSRTKLMFTTAIQKLFPDKTISNVEAVCRMYIPDVTTGGDFSDEQLAAAQRGVGWLADAVVGYISARGLGNEHAVAKELGLTAANVGNGIKVEL